MTKFNKGSEWRKWDLHVHTPFSYLNNGFGNDFDIYVQNLFKKAIEQNISAIGITDYFCIEGYKKIIQEYIGDDIKLSSLFSADEIKKIKEIAIFPNIEFRLDKLVGGNRINAHVIFSNTVSITDIEENFLHDLDFTYEGNPQSEDEKWKLKLLNIEELGTKLISEHAKFKGESNMFVGMKCAVVNDELITKTLNAKKTKFKGKYIFCIPSDEDLSSVSWDGQDHNVRKILIQKSDALVSSNTSTILWGLGKKHETQLDFVNEFKSLKPCIWGSDSHDYTKLFIPDNERFTWIKADLTFQGLKQIINEPEDRVFIGKLPSVLKRVETNKTKYIKKLSIDNIMGYDGKKGIWFKDINIELNSELVAIIGNKGSGKSAIADIIGLAGNTHNNKFSFLGAKRFKKGRLASNFEGKLEWHSLDIDTRNLNDDVIFQNIEKVRYLPQNHFEDLTNEIENNGFQSALESVVFGYIKEADKLGKTTFRELIDYKKGGIEGDIKILKDSLSELNKEIINLEYEEHPNFKKELESKLTERKSEASELQKILDEINKEKIENDTKEDDKTVKDFEKIVELNKKLETLKINIAEKQIELNKLNKSKEDISQLKHLIENLKDTFKNFKVKIAATCSENDIDIDKIVSLTANTDQLDEKLKEKELQIVKIKNLLKTGDEISYEFLDADSEKLLLKESIVVEKENIEVEINKIKKTLSEKQQKIQEHKESMLLISEKIKEIQGDIGIYGSIKYYEDKIQFIDKKLPELLVEKNKIRLEKSIEIFKKKSEIIDLYSKIKEPIDKKVLEEGKEFGDNLINIDAGFKLSKNFSEDFLGLILSNKIGSFYGKENGESKLSEIVSEKVLTSESDIKEILTSIIDYLKNDKRKDIGVETKRYTIDQTKDIIKLYEYIFQLDYIETEYELKMGEKKLDELSPGEKGTLLLIFYLMIDEEDIPLIIDQPEDNLDNQSVYKLLSKFIKKAKKKRQIILVTHNPNLAIGSDAEQIIYVNIDKLDNNTFSYISGSIENNEINEKVIEILEGTMPAFQKRDSRYIKR